MTRLGPVTRPLAVLDKKLRPYCYASFTPSESECQSDFFFDVGVNSCIENNLTHLFAMSLLLGVKEPLRVNRVIDPLVQINT